MFCFASVRVCKVLFCVVKGKYCEKESTGINWEALGEAVWPAWNKTCVQSLERSYQPMLGSMSGGPPTKVCRKRVCGVFSCTPTAVLRGFLFRLRLD